MDNEYQTLNDYQKLCFNYSIKRDFVEEILKYKCKRKLYEELKNWQRPILPVKGNVLKEMGCPGDRRLREILHRLCMIWVESNFTLTEQELLDNHLLKICEELQIDLDAVKSKKKKIS